MIKAKPLGISKRTPGLFLTGGFYMRTAGYWEPYSWLVHQGYVAPLGTMPYERAFLTDKALAAMNAIPSFGQTLGSELVKATEQASSESGKNKIAELVGTLLGSLIGSATKSVASG